MEINSHNSNLNPNNQSANPAASEKTRELFSNALKSAAEKQAQIAAAEETLKNEFKKKKDAIEQGTFPEDEEALEKELHEKLDMLKENLKKTLKSEQNRLGL